MPTLKELEQIVFENQSNLSSKTDIYNSFTNEMSNRHGLLSACDIKKGASVPSVGEYADSNICQSHGVIFNKKYPGCATQNSCKDRVKEYNSSVSDSRTALEAKKAAQEKYDVSVEALKNFVGTNPDVQKEIDSRKNKKVFIFVLIFLFVLVVLFYIFKKFKK